MGQFYYTVASLPLLRYGESISLTHQEYLEDCRKWLKPWEWRILKASTIVPETETEFPGIAEAYRRWEVNLRNELVRLRAGAQGLSAETYQRKGESFPDTAVLAATAFKESSPLEAEDVLNRGRWDFIESLKTGHFFDLEFLILYSLQLQIAERRMKFEEEKGYARYQEIYQNILSGIDNIGIGE